MRKSEIFKTAQLAVLVADFIGEHNKLLILRELMDKEDLAKFVEEKEEKEKADEAV
jgi:hypothetical protein